MVKLMVDIETLNPNQQEAVQTTDGPILVLAGAGSGKTKVLTTKIAYLINNKNVLPSSILAITFTNKAAKEMKNRVASLLGPIANRIQISTFHSFGLLVIKEHYDKLQFKSNFTILDSDDSLTIVKKIMREMGYDISRYNPKVIRNRISGAKNELMTPDDYEKYASAEFEQIVVSIYRKYQEKLLVTNSLDFDDLLMLPIKLFKESPNVLKEYQERFQYILIDEYQDTNEAQYSLVKMISAKYKNICVVGDNDQSIYSFRGSNYRNILNFQNDYENPKVIILEENYRSTKNILNAANSVIKNNKQRKEKNLWTDNATGDKIKYYRAMDEKDEAYYIVKEIKKLIDQGNNRDDIAILYRTNAQSRNIEDALLRETIPYKVVGSLNFYNRKEIKDLTAYLRLIYNQYDDVSLTRIINVPRRGIGVKTIDKLVEKATTEKKSIYEVIESGKELIFKNQIETLRQISESCSLTELVDKVLELTGLKASLVAENTIEADVRLENLEEFKSITKTFEERNGLVSLEDFLMEISLVTDVEEQKQTSDLVTLMTVHSAKGLEFDNVFIVGLEEGIFPHSNSFDSQEGLEEERRLCYVAITRARKRLWIVNAKRRILYGLDSCNPPSRFVSEIADEYIESENIDLKEMHTILNKEDNIDSTIEYKIGDKIIHEDFGEGIVVGVDKQIITVAFSYPAEIKKLIKGHKSIRKV